MKITELIKRLEEIREKHGDLKVTREEPNWGSADVREVFVFGEREDAYVEIY